MIWPIHYVLFNAGLSAILILLTLFLQTYSNASLTEIGTLLMVLPFLSIIAKPLFCALADRQQAHKQYLMGSLFFMGTGYGSLAIAPFFPHFIEHHGRLVWYLDVVGVVIGFSAFGVAWSLGDALAVNAARLNNVPWGSYRAWATASWGVFGLIVGQINETPLLPKYVPGFLVLALSCVIEIILLALWPKSAFDMTGEQQQPEYLQQEEKATKLIDAQTTNGQSNGRHHHQQAPGSPTSATDTDLEMNDAWAFNGTNNKSLSGTLSGSARFNPRLMGAMANLMMEEVGSSLKNSLKLGHPQKRLGLSEILENHQLTNGGSRTPVLLHKRQSLIASPSLPQKILRDKQQQHQAAAPPQSPLIGPKAAVHLYQQHDSSVHNQGTLSKASTFGKSALRRTQLALSRMNSLSSATGHAIADELNYNSNTATCGTPTSIHKQMMLSSLASFGGGNASLGRAAVARALGLSATATLKEIPGQDDEQLNQSEEQVKASKTTSGKQEQHNTINENGHFKENNEDNFSLSLNREKSSQKDVEDLQIILLKLIVKRDISIVKYLVLFTLYGILFTIHIAYFFMHVEQLCREKGYAFSGVMGSMTMAHSISEVFSFLVIVPYIMPRLGRFGSMLSIVLIFAIRYSYYGTYFVHLSPYTAVLTETCHGFAYGITYSLITEIAGECVNQLDAYLPELIERGIVDPDINPNELKLPLRATMYGLFSGAFDGLGNGIGALIAGIYLDSHTFVSLWLLCTYISLGIAVIYPLTEWRYLCRRKVSDSDLDSDKQQNPSASRSSSLA